MESEKESKKLADQHKKAESLLTKLSSDLQTYIGPMLELQKLRNFKYLDYTTELKHLEQRYEEQYSPLYSQRAEILKTFNGFWLKVIKNNPLCSSLIYPKDESLLHYLVDIKCITDPCSDNFVIEFYFTTNEFIENEVLRKKYIMADSEIMEKGVGTEIRWKGENFTIENTSEEERKLNSQKLSKNCGSFFNFFKNVSMPTPAEIEGMDESIEEEFIESAEQDFDIATEFRDEIVPNAILYYFGTKIDLDKE